MSEIIVLARLRVMATDAQLIEYRDQLEKLAPNRDGLLGYSAWRSLEADGGLMQIMRYSDQAVADEALQALVNSQIGPLVASVTIDPPDVLLVAPKRHQGKSLEDSPTGSFLSFVNRFADPGQQEELELDTDEVVSELAFMPGYQGALWGNNVTLKEEIVSIVLWDNLESLGNSISNSHTVKLQRWQKAF